MLGFPGGPEVKNLSTSAADRGSSPGPGEIPHADKLSPGGLNH